MNKRITLVSLIILFMCVFLCVQSGIAYMIEDETLVKAYNVGSEYNGTGSISKKEYGEWVDVVGDENLYDTYGIDITIDESYLRFDIYTNFPELGDPDTEISETGINWLIPADLFFSIDIYKYGVALTDHQFGSAVDNSIYDVYKGSLYSEPDYQTSLDIFKVRTDWIYGGRYDKSSPKDVPVLITDNETPWGQCKVEWIPLAGGATDDPKYRIDVDVPLLALSNPDISQIDVLFGTAICGNDVITGSAPVPEPATMLLFGTGLLGLAGMGRKRWKLASKN